MVESLNIANFDNLNTLKFKRKPLNLLNQKKPFNNLVRIKHGGGLIGQIAM